MERGRRPSLARQLLLDRLPETYTFLNADFIAEGISPFRPQKAALQAEKEFFARFDRLAEQGESFVLESTLSGHSLATRLSDLQTNGYLIEMVYLWLPSVEMAARRVQERVKQGGHEIPSEIIERRFARSYPNFLNAYLRIADKWTLLDGSETPPSEIATFAGHEVLDVLQLKHPAYRELAATLEGRGEEPASRYGRDAVFYTDNLDPILKAVGEFLRQLEEVVS